MHFEVWGFAPSKIITYFYLFYPNSLTFSKSSKINIIQFNESTPFSNIINPNILSLLIAAITDTFSYLGSTVIIEDWPLNKYLFLG